MNAGGDVTARLFFALVPPLPLQRALGDLARSVARAAHGRPVPAENFHLTLAFIGQWPLGRLPELLAAGASVGTAPLHLTLDVQGGFRRAGVAWVGASAPPAGLIELADALAALVSSVGATLDERPFHAHLTLARKCRGPYAHEPVGPIAWDIDHVALMQSDTRKEGARYTRLAQWPLRRADR